MDGSEKESEKMKSERQFKGVWISADLFLRTDLCPAEKLLLADIDSFTGRKSVYYKSNATIAKMLNVGETSVKKFIKHLIDLKEIEVVGFTGRMRYLKTVGIRLADRSNPTGSKPESDTKYSNEKLHRDLSNDKEPSAPGNNGQKKEQQTHELIRYYAEKHEQRRGFEPSINWAAWGAVFKRLQHAATPDAIKQVIDTFFAYKGRTKMSVYDFEKAFDNVYGYIVDKAKGRR